MKNSGKIAVIGAGIAGSIIASELKKSGIPVSVFESSSRAGGRLSSHREEVSLKGGSVVLSYDYGAPTFEAMSGPFRNEFSVWTGKGWVARWGAFGYCVGAPTMADLPRRLLEQPGIDLRLASPVESLERDESHAWFVRVGQERFGPYSDVVLTAPAPQSLRLLEGHSESLSAVLKAVLYEPCWVLTASWLNCAATQESLDLARSSWQSIFSRITEESAKPGREIRPEIRSFAFQAMPGWSTEHLEAPAEQVRSLLLAEAERAVACGSGDLLHAEAHLWRYARVIVGAPKAFFSDRDAGLHACGDAFMGDGVENAWMSAISLKRALVQEALPRSQGSS